MDSAFDLNSSPGKGSCPDETKTFESKFGEQIGSSQSVQPLRRSWRHSNPETRSNAEHSSARQKDRDSLARKRRLARTDSRVERIGSRWNMSSGGLKVLLIDDSAVIHRIVKR